MGNYNNLPDAKKEVMTTLNKIGKAAAIQVFNKIIVQTPVDTGRARANWQASVNNIKQGVLQTLTMEHPETAISGAQLQDILYLSNNLPYIEALEYGHSQQRPSGWVRAAVGEGQIALDNAVRKVLGGV